MRPSGAGLVNVHFPECTFVLNISLPTIREYASVGGCLCAGLGNEHFLEGTFVSDIHC